jgi:hypothetical protein
MSKKKENLNSYGSSLHLNLLSIPEPENMARIKEQTDKFNKDLYKGAFETLEAIINKKPIPGFEGVTHQEEPL